MKLHSPFFDFTDVWIISYEDGQTIRVDINFSAKIIEPKVASILLNRVCDLLAFMATHVQDPLPVPSDSFQHLPKLPIMALIESSLPSAKIEIEELDDANLGIVNEVVLTESAFPD